MLLELGVPIIGLMHFFGVSVSLVSSMRGQVVSFRLELVVLLPLIAFSADIIFKCYSIDFISLGGMRASSLLSELGLTL